MFTARLWWAALAVASVAALAVTAWSLLVPERFHFDTQVYRMGAQAWLDGHPLYGDVLFETGIKDDRQPFTYPPVAAVIFSPLTWVSLIRAGTIITALSIVSLVLSIVLVLSSLSVCGPAGPGPVWLRRACLAAAITAAAVWLGVEPVVSTFDLGQINHILMALVLVDCLPRRTPWPRGLLVGLAAAVKLTPAVFVLYFLVRRDTRAVWTVVAAFVAITLAGFVLAQKESVQYWFGTVGDTDRIGPAGRPTNQNLAGLLLRAGLDGSGQLAVWVLVGLAVLALTIWAARRALATGEPALALIVVALAGLVGSPVSWSHHWVWFVPAIVTLGVVGIRRRNILLGVAAAVGLVIAHWEPMRLLTPESGWWIQFVGTAYVWWALAVMAIAGAAMGAATPLPCPECDRPAQPGRCSCLP